MRCVSRHRDARRMNVFAPVVASMWYVAPLRCAAVEFPIFNVQKDHGMALSAPVIKSITTDGGTVVGGSTNVNELVLQGTAAANSTVSVFDGTTFLGTTTVNSA